MRLPQHLLDSQFFGFSNVQELIAGLGDFVDSEELEEIRRLSEMKLPPVTSKETLAAMLGINPGLIWSFQNRTNRHYRTFPLRKGSSVRQIDAPKVALKIIQKWLSWHFQAVFVPPEHVFGFVPGRSHIDAAAVHCGANWVYSVDIEKFFPTTPQSSVLNALLRLGYGPTGADLIASLCCLRGFLAQGAPTSPVLSNIVFSETDRLLLELAGQHNVKITRYADDIVFSGSGDFPQQLGEEVQQIFARTPWKLSGEKTHFSKLPNRLKVHGLLVHGEMPRLTKGYRNRIRAFKHVMARELVKEEDIAKLKGHIQFSSQVQSARRRMG